MNVLLIVIDSMRADMPWNGYPRDIAPNLTKLAEQAVNYTRTWSVSSYTAKSIGSLLSGQYPSTLRRNGATFTTYSRSNLFFPELLEQAGVHTIASHATQCMNPRYHLNQGFLDYRVLDVPFNNNGTDTHITGEKMTRLALEQLAAIPADRPFFAYLHYMDPHDDYVQHPESPVFGKKARDRYDSEIFYVDKWVNELLTWCRAQPFFGKTALIITGDHGEGFGEHGKNRHGYELWNELTHVPLLFVLPEVSPTRIDVARSHIDLAPTILELMHVKPDPVFAGKSLVAELRGKQAPEPRPVLLELPLDEFHGERTALIEEGYKLVVFGSGWRRDLYDLNADFGETRNLVKTEKVLFQTMVERHQSLFGALPRLRPWGGIKLADGTTANGKYE